MKCPKCGNEFEGNFCPNCGTPVSPQQNIPPQPVSPPLMQFGGQGPSIPYHRKQFPLWGIFAIIATILFLIFISNSKVGTALEISAALGILMFAVALIVSLIRKRFKKSNLIGLIVCFFFTIMAVNALPRDSNISVPVANSAAASVAPSSEEDVSLTPAEQEEYDKLQDKSRQEVEDADKSKAEYVDPKEIYKAYQDNEIKADSKYKGRNIIIKVTVSSIGRNVLGNAYITSSVSSPFGIYMSFDGSAESQISELKSGQTIIVSGTCSGKSVEDVMIDGCSIVG